MDSRVGRWLTFRGKKSVGWALMPERLETYT